jgi:hypothetical protein
MQPAELKFVIVNVDTQPIELSLVVYDITPQPTCEYKESGKVALNR